LGPALNEKIVVLILSLQSAEMIERVIDGFIILEYCFNVEMTE